MAEPEGTFQAAPPGRRVSSGPAAAFPDAVAPAGERKSSKEGPQAVLPSHVLGPAAPDGGVAMIPVFLFVVGVGALVTRNGTATIVLGALFLLAGGIGAYAWILAWWAYRKAWAFERNPRPPLWKTAGPQLKRSFRSAWKERR